MTRGMTHRNKSEYTQRKKNQTNNSLFPVRLVDAGDLGY